MADEADAVGLAEMVGLDDVRVDQVGDQLGLADEILDEHLLAGEIRADDLDGHALDEVARAVLLGFIHDAHAALKNFADDFVAEFVLDGEERHADGRKLPREVKPRLGGQNGGKACNFFVFLLARFPEIL
jgi:hypothetical protein